jgi:hypothetical protein
MAAVGLDILAQCRHLERACLDDHRHGAVLDAGGHRLEAGSRDAADHLRRRRRGGDIDLRGLLAEQGIAHRATHHARLFRVAVEHAKEPRQWTAREPRHAGEIVRAGRALVGRRVHCVVPGTNLPPSTWAGT